MARWLLSGHNPRETFGTPYPITVSYTIEFAARRQLEYIVGTLAGGTDEFDMAIRPMVSVQGYLYMNMHYFTRNVALVVPFDVESFGAPKELVVAERKPRLKTRLLLPFRLWGIYRQVVQTQREVIPHYRESLEEAYWRLRATNPDQITERDIALVDRLFAPSMLDNAAAYMQAYAMTTLLGIAISEFVGHKTPDLLNLLVGRGSSTAKLATYVWELRQVAEQCGLETSELLRRGETDLAKYRAIPEATPLLKAIERFMRTYGHRAFRYSSEFEATRLADQPELVLLTIGGLLEEDEPPTVRAEAARQVGSQALRKMNPLQRLLWRRLLKWGSALVERREEGRDTLELQNASWGLAAKLLSRHYFPDRPPDYLWLYTFDEFLALAHSHGQRRVDPEEIARRRAELERHRQQPALPELIWYDPKAQQWWPVQEAEAEERALTSEGRLQGIGASAGSGPVEGLALVTDNAQEAAERLLEIRGPVVLVTHVTDPVWSSLFRRLTAVVTEMGGAISHAALVARENGIPAVVGVPVATRWIHDGQWVRVDGAAGTVEVIE